MFLLSRLGAFQPPRGTEPALHAGTGAGGQCGSALARRSLSTNTPLPHAELQGAHAPCHIWRRSRPAPGQVSPPRPSQTLQSKQKEREEECGINAKHLAACHDSTTNTSHHLSLGRRSQQEVSDSLDLRGSVGGKAGLTGIPNRLLIDPPGMFMTGRCVSVKGMLLWAARSMHAAEHAAGGRVGLLTQPGRKNKYSKAVFSWEFHPRRPRGSHGEPEELGRKRASAFSLQRGPDPSPSPPY